MTKKYNKGFLGDTPAAIYLVDLLNTSTNKSDVKVIRLIQTFRTLFKKLTEAYNNEHIDKSIMHAFINSKKIELNLTKDELLQDGVTPLVVNLYVNVITGELKHVTRLLLKKRLFEISAIDRAKDLLKNKNVKRKDVSINTYGRINGNVEQKIDVEVMFDKHGFVQAMINKDEIVDDVTSEKLMEKSVNRLKKLGKYNY